MSSTSETKVPKKKLDEILGAIPVVKETTSGLTSAFQLVNSTNTVKLVSDTTDASHLYH